MATALPRRVSRIDGRQSYAVGMYNDAARKALASGIVEDHGREPMFAHDRMGARYAGLTEEEHDKAVAYRENLAVALVRNEALAAALERALEIARRNEASPDLDHAARVLEENRRGKADE